MCGRFTLRTSPQEVAKAFDLGEAPDFRLRYNVSPTQHVLATRLRDGKRQACFHRWGLIASWADDPSIDYRMINARAETVAEKPSYRSAFKRGRCLIVADGFVPEPGTMAIAIIGTLLGGSAAVLTRRKR
jgi:putative SOS response-associated peptidase YedK